MFVTTKRESDPREHNRLLLAGVAYVLVTALLIALSIAIYNKAFHTYTDVTLKADRAGLQLAEHGDVRYNGVLVGQVRSITQKGDRADILLGLEPSFADNIPRDVDADIVPTTLFGQKFVSLVPQSKNGPVGIPDGTVIPADRVHTSVELGQVLARLFPLLEAVRPGDLAATLSALATALNGRGNEIGQSMEKLDSYLTTMNVHLPTLREDLRLFASVAHTYNVAAPDLLRMLANLTVTARTITAKKQSIGNLMGDVTGVSNLGATILEDNGTNIIRGSQLSKPILDLLARYSPEYNCLLRGIAAYKPILRKTFEGGQVKQYVEFPTTQRRSYDKRDLPEYNDKRGPYCYGLPHDPPAGRWYPWPGLDLKNGTNLDSKSGLGNSYFPAGANPGPNFAQELIKAMTGQSVAYRGDGTTPQQRRATTAILSTQSGQPTSSISPLATLMYTPMIHRRGVA